MRDEIYRRLREHLAAEELTALATIITGPGIGSQILVRPDGTTSGTLGNDDLDRRATQLAAGPLRSFAAERTSMETDGGSAELFIEVYPPPPRLIVVGAVHVAIHLVEFARPLGFHTVVVDPRTAFATAERFAAADELIAEWPQAAFERLPLNEASHFVFLSHDLKIDVPGMVIALSSPARYVGALGSKKTHRKRLEALRQKGVADDQIARLHAPIGLDLGGRRAVEIALAIIAQIVAVDHGRAS